MLQEQPVEMPWAHAQAGGQVFHAVLIQDAFGNKPQTAAYGRRGSVPSGGAGCGLRPAAQTGTEPGFRRRRRGGVITHVLTFGAGCRADAPAINAGGGDADEKAAIEARIMGQARLFAGFFVQFHRLLPAKTGTRCSPYTLGQYLASHFRTWLYPGKQAGRTRGSAPHSHSLAAYQPQAGALRWVRLKFTGLLVAGAVTNRKGSVLDCV